ncbi:MAG: bacteriohopanetetrol glucosamine biosynthesis glycosyltransferase HpnI [Blastocatellia bacterium]|nr:bacteriohopanetetrol glucosamine biosynthesis glycosyltransferase HpnI [Blastocatellia bacterium]
MQFFFWIFLLLLLATISYQVVALINGFLFFSRDNLPSDHFPPISLLKPVRGVEDTTYQCFASFCNQDYPDYEIIFAVQDANDPVVELITKLQHSYSNCKIKLVVNSSLIGANAKVSNLYNALPHAKHNIILISDSDIKVNKDYLRYLVKPFSDKKTGVVTTLYRAVGNRHLTTILEAIGISTDFLVGVVVARGLGNVDFALGATMAIKKEVLNKIGGFSSFADYLGDDYMLGNLTAKAGYQVEILNYVVETVMPDYDFTSFFRHQVRWARNIRYSRPGGYLGLIFTQTTAISLLSAIFFYTSNTILILSLIALLIRLLVAWVVGIYGLKDLITQKYFFLTPIRDIVGFVVWLISFFGNSIEWRGSKFRVIQGGKLIKTD